MVGTQSELETAFNVTYALYLQAKKENDRTEMARLLAMMRDISTSEQALAARTVAMFDAIDQTILDPAADFYGAVSDGVVGALGVGATILLIGAAMFIYIATAKN